MNLLEAAGCLCFLGLALAFAAVVSLASFAGCRAVGANRYGRIAALALIALFGLTMLTPTLAVPMMAPIVSSAQMPSHSDRAND